MCSSDLYCEQNAISLNCNFAGRYGFTLADTTVPDYYKDWQNIEVICSNY